MFATSVVESPRATGLEPSAEAARPDVGVLVGADGAHRAMAVALRKAAASGGDVCVIRYVDNIGIRSPDPLIRRSQVARSQLAQIVSEQQLARHDETRVTERLHVGTLESLLSTLEPSIGSVVFEGAQGPLVREIVALCPVPVSVVDATGSTITYDPAPRRRY